ncbi:MAG: transcription elongation factor GreA [Spirochaetes bacterium]|nr:transcription elongation factor GreA [Spirochaetota bacterium]
MNATMEKEKILERLTSLFKEEQWGRIDPKDIGISKFRILDDLFNNLVRADLLGEASNQCKAHLDEHPDSIIASYLVGVTGHHLSRIEDTRQLRILIDLFTRHHKWAIVEILADKVLEYGENRVALKALAISLERLGRNREATAAWESLLKIDRFDTDVAKKLAFAIIDEDPEKSVQYMKLSIEGFIKKGEYNEIPALWNKLISVSIDEEDSLFFDRIERMLIEAKQNELAANLLKSLLNKHRDKENPEQSIEILKKILNYTPDETNARRDLIKFYQLKYGEHSQYEQFLKLSKITNYKYPIKHAIQDFEKNIVFDKGNYVYHRSWGVGKIAEINSEAIIIDFNEKSGHKMTIQMALQSLMPIQKDHLYALEHEDPESLQKLFKENFLQFFEILIKSYDGSILLADIKKELIPKYVPQKDWSKWWSRARTEIKKNPHFGVSVQKKDLITIRDKPLTFADELLNNFTNSDSFSEKLDIAIEFVNHVDSEDGSAVAPYFVDYFSTQVKESSATKEILSFFILSEFDKYIDTQKLKLYSIRSKIVEFIKSSNELPLISMSISSYDYKKDLINLIEETREDWPQVVSDILFETPVRIHKYIINNLIRSNAFNIINLFIDKTLAGAKQNPEIFLWVAKNILSGTWDYYWLDYSYEGLILTFFRLLNELKKIETKGNRLKNMAIDILLDNEYEVIKDIVEQCSETALHKIYDLFKNISYIEESEIEKLHSFIISKHPDFKSTEVNITDEEWELESEKIIVTKEGYDRMQAELNRMVNNELVNLSKELAKASDISGDLRENVEYNALMERQTILKLTINRLEDEIKKVEIIDPAQVSTEKVNIGTKVNYTDTDTNENNHYIILGPWDADYDKRILSYRSPIAKVFLGKSVEEHITLKLGEGTKNFKIVSVEKIN